MAHSDWMPTREQDLVDLCVPWKAELENPANITAYSWEQADVTAALGKIAAFLTARFAYEVDNSTAKRLDKDETTDAMRDFANSSIRLNKKMSDA
ncbi:MAG: hypothetical protein LBP19_01990 [Treponema sp.]|nr:hypothetical protein [Treponema sp.]